jgi:hypothetical protein
MLPGHDTTYNLNKMAISYNPRIITDGLVLYTDAGNSKSYPGSGTILTDLSGNGNTGTLVGGVGYSSDNLGALTFDGLDDHVDISGALSGLNLSNNQNISYDFFIFPEEQQGYILWAATGTAGVRANQQYSILWTSDNKLSASGGTTGANVTDTIPTNTWYHVVMTLSRENNLSLYINLEKVLDFSPGSINSADQIRVGNRNGGVQYKGRVSAVKGYNKILSSQEIYQNFNATRSRYNL